MVGFANKRTIFIFSPIAYVRESDHTDPARYWKTLVHEQAHIYIQELSQGNTPRWLNEGLACYLARQKARKPDRISALSVVKWNNNVQIGVYALGLYWVKRFIKLYGRTRLIKLLVQISHGKKNARNFQKAFRKVYGFSWNKSTLDRLYR